MDDPLRGASSVNWNERRYQAGNRWGWKVLRFAYVWSTVRMDSGIHGLGVEVARGFESTDAAFAWIEARYGTGHHQTSDLLYDGYIYLTEFSPRIRRGSAYVPVPMATYDAEANEWIGEYKGIDR